MGDYILMKKLLLLTISTLFPLALIANTELSSHEVISEQIAEIKPPRLGVSSVAVAKVNSPFIYLKTIKTKSGKKVTVLEKKRHVKLPPLKLESAINKNIKVNGKWYKEGDRIREYTIMKVSSDEVYLKSKNRDLKLYLNHKNDKIQFKVN